MSKNDSWGNSLNANLQHQINLYVDNIKRLYGYGINLTEFHIFNVLLKELCGTYQFKTKNKSLLLQENKFFYNLFFWGMVGLYYNKSKDKFIICRVNSIKLNEFSELVSVDIFRADNYYNTSTVNNDKVITLKNNELDNFILVCLDISNEPFMIKYGWIATNFIKMFNRYMTSTGLKNKPFFIHKNTTQEKIWKAFVDSVKNDDEPWITLENPEISNSNDTSSALLEKPFIIEEFKKLDNSFIDIEDVIKFWKFAKDLIGMNANTSQKKERVISTELEDAELNTILMNEVEMKNFRLLENELKEKFNIDLKVLKTKDVYGLQHEENKKVENESMLDEGDNVNE